MFLFLTTLWFFWELKYVLFWLYLWQLKEYHFGRFVDHFSTSKGKKLLFGYAQIFKLFLLLFLLLNNSLFSYLFSILFIVYFVECILFLRQLFLKSFKKPVGTYKILFLSLISFAVVIVFLNWIFSFKDELQLPWLIIFDILTPLIISAIVLLFQPCFVAMRKKTLHQATEKIKKIKSVSGLKVIAITGSYGKTSTKEFLATILSKKYKVLSTKDHQNSEIGVARAILNFLKPSHQIFIAEVGAYNKGKVKEVCQMIMPKIGVVTGINQQHLALFGSMDNLLSAEGGGELLESLPKDGIIFVNGENKYCLDLIKKSNKLPENQEKIYALSKKVVNADILADGIDVKKNSVSFLAMNRKNEMAHFEAKVLGEHNVQNLLGAILVANESGMSFEEIASALQDIKQNQSGMVLKNGKHGMNIIDSSYSANPDGVVADLEYLKIFPNKKIIVMFCLIELGVESAVLHEMLGKKIGEICDMAIITSNDYFDEIKKGAMSAGMAEKNVILNEKPQEIYSAITTFCKTDDAVLLEGRVPKELVSLLSK